MSNIKDEVLVNVYGINAPAAAVFNKGATTRAEIEQATAARRDLALEQGSARGAPVRRDSR